MGIKPIGMNILFEWSDQQFTQGGIALPSGHSAESNSSSIIATVIGVGGLVKHVKVGDKIVIPKLMKTPVDTDKGLYITTEAQVLAIL